MGYSKNPYVSRSKPKLRQSIVAFVDMLGYSAMVKKSFADGTSEILLGDLHKTLKESHKQINPRFRESRPYLHKDSYAFRAFSDNIVIGYPIRDDGRWELSNLIRYLSYFQMELTMNGFFIRGAISIGELYMDEITVFGPALLEAYEAEQKLARDPRIILTASTKELFRNYFNHSTNIIFTQQFNDFLKDADGQYFLNYLDTLIMNQDYIFEPEVKNIKMLLS